MLMVGGVAGEMEPAAGRGRQVRGMCQMSHKPRVREVKEVISHIIQQKEARPSSSAHWLRLTAKSPGRMASLNVGTVRQKRPL